MGPKSKNKLRSQIAVQAAAAKRRKSTGEFCQFKLVREKNLESANTSMETSFGASGLSLTDNETGKGHFQLIVDLQQIVTFVKID